MMTVIIPTMWRTLELKKILDTLTPLPVIDRIHLINNDAFAFRLTGKFLIKTQNNPKLRVHTPPQNIYITEAWNHGALEADTEFICLLNDDIVLESHAYEFVINNWPSDAGIIGLGYNSLHVLGGAYHLHAINQRPHGWGQCMFIKRSAYQPIPEDLKLWFNDDWLFKYTTGQHYQMVGPYTGQMSATTSDPAFNSIKDQDTINWKKYE